MNLGSNNVLQVVHPVYGIPESRLHWYRTYLDHHLTEMNMTRPLCDPCVIFHLKNSQRDGIVILQVDDSFSLGTASFFDDEDKASLHLNSKLRTMISTAPTPFNGTKSVRSPNKSIIVTQPDEIEKLSPTNTNQQFTNQRARAQYIGICTRPDIFAQVQLIAPTSEAPTPAEHTILAKTLSQIQETSQTRPRITIQGRV